MDEAKTCSGEKVILFNFSGHGYFDLSAYEAYLSGKMTNSDLSEEALAQSLCQVK